MGAALLIAVVFLRGKKKKAPPTLEDIGKADATIKDMELKESYMGDLQWNLRAKEANLFEKEGIAYLKKVTLIYSLGDEGKLIVTSNRGKIQFSQKNVFLEGNIVASSNALSFKAKDLAWFQEKRLLSSEGPIFIRRQNIETTGKKMVADIISGKIILQQDVQTIIYD